MNGIVNLTVSYGEISYNLEFRHNISILSGDSGTGKTALCALITQREEDDLNHSKSAVDIKVNQDIAVKVLHNNSAWRAVLADIKDSLVFIDDNCSFVTSEQFARAVKDTSNYYAIINRSVLCGNLCGDVYYLVKDNITKRIKNVPVSDISKER